MKTSNKLKIILLFVFVIGFALSCNKKNADTKITEQTKQKDTIVKNPYTSLPPTLDTTTNKPTNIVENQGKVIVLNTETFKQRVFNYDVDKDWNYLGDKPALVDFYADWCKPCKRLEPIFDELAKEYSGRVYFYRINVDENREVATVFGIRSIPSVLFIPMDDKPQMGVGAYPKDFYVKAIKDILKVQ